MILDFILIAIYIGGIKATKGRSIPDRLAWPFDLGAYLARLSFGAGD